MVSVVANPHQSLIFSSVQLKVPPLFSCFVYLVSDSFHENSNPSCIGYNKLATNYGMLAHKLPGLTS